MFPPPKFKPTYFYYITSSNNLGKKSLKANEQNKKMPKFYLAPLVLT